MFPRYTSLILPRLTRCQANAVEFATKVCFSLFDGSEVSATDVRYKGEIVQRVAPQKLVTCLVYRYTEAKATC